MCVQCGVVMVRSLQDEDGELHSLLLVNALI